MEILEILEEIEDTVEKNFSLFGYAFTNKEDLLSMLEELRLKMPDEIKQAKAKAEQIVADASAQELEMRKNALAYADSMLERVESLSNSVVEQARESRRQLKNTR